MFKNHFQPQQNDNDCLHFLYGFRSLAVVNVIYPLGICKPKLQLRSSIDKILVDDEVIDRRYHTNMHRRDNYHHRKWFVFNEESLMAAPQQFYEND